MALKRFDIFVSEAVIEEVSMGDRRAAQKRLNEIITFSSLELNKKVQEVAKVYKEELKIPDKSLRDVVHLATAAVHNIDYLITWNCTHLANGTVIKKLFKINEKLDILTPIICTPEELMED